MKHRHERVVVGMTWAALIVALLCAGCAGPEGAREGEVGREPAGAEPAAYLAASPIVGGRLYDRWWGPDGGVRPEGDHPLYPAEGQKSGTTTWRCKECHGWDYRGIEGAYSAGSHRTGIAGVMGARDARPAELFEALSGGIAGHDLSEQLDAQARWALVRFVREGVLDTTALIDDETRRFSGAASEGAPVFEAWCVDCHGERGMTLNFGAAEAPEYVGTIANDNPWEFLHKVRFGHPGTEMPALFGAVPLETLGDLGAFAQTLPTGEPAN